MGSNKHTVEQTAGTIATPERALQSAITTFSTTFSSIASCLPRSGRTTTRSARHSSTSRSTWSSTPAMSTCPWLLISTVMTKLFQESSNEGRDHGMKLMEYQAKRGGRVVFQDIAKPSSMECGTPLEAVEAALELEKTVNQSLLDLHKVAGDKGDGHLCDFL